MIQYSQNQVLQYDLVDIMKYDQNITKIEILNNLNRLNKQIQPQKFQRFLVRLFYCLNQGLCFNEAEREQLFFGVIKLHYCTNPNLRSLIFKIIQILNVRKLIYMIIQSLVSDLASNNQYLRQNAIKCISLLNEDQQIIQIENQIRNALLDKNEYISNLVMIQGLQIYKKYPNLISNKYSAIIIERLSKSYFKNKQHAFNLIHEIKKSDTNSMLKIIVSLKTQELTHQVNIQMMRYIKEILIQNEVHLSMYNVELQQYLLQQMYYSESIIFIEAAGLVIQIPSIINEQLKPMMRFIMNYLNSMVSNIETYTALKLIKKLQEIPERLSLIQYEQIELIEKLTFSPHISVSSYAIFICIQYQLSNSNENIGEYLKQIYLKQELSQYNFLYGIFELIHITDEWGDYISSFFILIIPQNCSVELANIAFEISEKIFTSQIINYFESMEILFWIAQSHDIKCKLRLLQLIHTYLFKKPPIRVRNDQKILRYYNIVQNHIFPKLNDSLCKLNIQIQ